MYYEEYERRRGRRRKKRRRGCLSVLLRFVLKVTALALAAALLLTAALYYLPIGAFQSEPDYNLSLTDGLPDNPMNILLLGVDVLDSGSQRSDTMIIASIDRESVKLTSVQRDLRAEIEGHGTAKLNAAYAYGGPNLVMRTINETFDMNIMKYVVVDFTVLVRLVDALGGIDVDITEAEMKHINKNVWNSRHVFAPLGYVGQELTAYGENTHLDGLQALGYARIRKLDSDFARTGRQRIVIGKMLGKLRANLYNPVMLARFVSAAFDGMETNLSALQMISLGSKAVLTGGIEQLRLPMNGTFDDNGSSLTMTDRGANISALREFIYG